jgi:hypothetical protein
VKNEYFKVESNENEDMIVDDFEESRPEFGRKPDVDKPSPK